MPTNGTKRCLKHSQEVWDARARAQEMPQARFGDDSARPPCSRVSSTTVAPSTDVKKTPAQCTSSLPCSTSQPRLPHFAADHALAKRNAPEFRMTRRMRRTVACAESRDRRRALTCQGSCGKACKNREHNGERRGYEARGRRNRALHRLVDDLLAQRVLHDLPSEALRACPRALGRACLQLQIQALILALLVLARLDVVLLCEVVLIRASGKPARPLSLQSFDTMCRTPRLPRFWR